MMRNNFMIYYLFDSQMKIIKVRGLIKETGLFIETDTGNALILSDFPLEKKLFGDFLLVQLIDGSIRELQYEVPEPIPERLECVRKEASLLEFYLNSFITKFMEQRMSMTKIQEA